MNVNLQQGRLLRAIDSKDFGNVAEVLHEGGPVEFPGLRFELLPNGDVLVEYDAANPKSCDLCKLMAKFTLRHGRLFVESRLGVCARVPARPRFRLVARRANSPILR